MATVILDAELAKRLRAQRAEQGADRFDEVWEGTYMMAPAPNNEHQGVVNGLTAILQDVIGWPKLGSVFPGVNISDRAQDWQDNFRCPQPEGFGSSATRARSRRRSAGNVATRWRFGGGTNSRK